MKQIPALALAAAVFALPAGAFACDSCGHKAHRAPVYRPVAAYAAPAPCAPAYQPCATVVEPACPTPCFNPLSIVGGVVSGVGSAIGAVGQGIAGAFGSCNPCY